MTIAWFDDLAVGMQFKSGEARITAQEIKRFAAEFDPQPMHLDEKAASRTFFKGLAASGWHTASIAMRLLVESRPFGDHPIIGIGGGVRWLAQCVLAMSCVWKARSKASRHRRASRRVQ